MAPKKPENALVVKVFAYPTTVEGNGPDDDRVRPLEGAEVTLTDGPCGPLMPPPEKPTDDHGIVRFDDLDKGDYKIKVDAPANYKLPPTKQVWTGPGLHQGFDCGIPVREGGEVVVQVGICPEAGKVTGQITVPVCGSPGDIAVEARAGGTLVDSGANEPDADRYELADIDEPGVIEIIPQAEISGPDGRTYVPKPGHASQFVVVPPGQTPGVTVDIEYVLTKAEIKVAARLVQNINGKTERKPLDGVTFRLFKLGATQPLEERTTQDQFAAVFTDLGNGQYRIVAVPPADSQGRRLQLTRPPGPELNLQLHDGQSIDLTREFEFQASRGSVRGSVVVGYNDSPVSGVPVVLTSLQQPQIVEREVTNAGGEYEVTDLPVGNYRVALEQRLVIAQGQRWELEPNGHPDAVRTVEVKDRATALVPEFRLVKEEHLITGKVIGPDGKGAQFVTVQIFSDNDPDITRNKPVGNTSTDEHGEYTYRAQFAGKYYVRVYQPDGFAPQFTPVAVHSSVVVPTLRTFTQPPAAQNAAAPAPPTPSGQDNDFPFLTEEVDLDSRGGSGRSTGAAGGGVGGMVERQIREVLGWRPRTSDPKGFQAALNQAFTVREVQGHTEVDWNPRSYSVEIQADLGAITGAQASIHTRAKGTLDQVLSLLGGLTALRVDYDKENVEAIRAIVRSQLTELVNELGVEGGPRVQRVDQLLEFLLGPPPLDARCRPRRGRQRDPDDVGGSLGVLRDRLGLVRGRINTIDEEQNFTNFLVVLDQVVGLAESWDAQRDFFVRGGTVEPFLGTQLVLLSRDLEVVSESVREVEFAMDSVFLGPAERQTLELRFDAARDRLVAESPPMFVAELLSWVEQFASEEGRRLIDDGGRQGVAAVKPTVDLLKVLVKAAQVSPDGEQDPNRMPAAYRRPRVQRALAELAQQLANAADRIKNIKPPIEDIPPTQTAGVNGSSGGTVRSPMN